MHPTSRQGRGGTLYSARWTFEVFAEKLASFGRQPRIALSTPQASISRADGIYGA